MFLIFTGISSLSSNVVKAGVIEVQLRSLVRRRSASRGAVCSVLMHFFFLSYQPLSFLFVFSTAFSLAFVLSSFSLFRVIFLTFSSFFFSFFFSLSLSLSVLISLSFTRAPNWFHAIYEIIICGCSSSGSEVAALINDYMKQGAIVPVEITIGLIEKVH